MNPNAHILIYVHKITPRVKYTFHLIFKDCLGLDFTLTTSIDDYQLYGGVKLSYTTQELESVCHFEAVPLLFESGIHEQVIQIHNHEHFYKYFFKTYKSALPFDVFAASFYLVSRYEEYLPFKPDMYNRYEVENSLAYQYDFLHIPLVNLWVSELEKILLKKFPRLSISHRNYNYISTIDVDNAYKFKEKGIMRSLGGYLKSIVRFQKKELIQRTAVLLGKEKDPFDTYDYQLQVQKQHKVNTIYFFLLGDYGVNDKNHPSNNYGFQKLIKHLADYYTTGIHPSYGSTGKPQQIKIEINRLANITHREIFHSRQHFSMLKFPETYYTLQELGITNEYSMGYRNHNGFRASYCYPFYWYDLDEEIETNLKIHPFCISITSLRFRDKATPQNATEKAAPIINEVKKYGGELITIFHNDTMGTSPEWIDWKVVYEDMIKLAVNS
ncbi:MAG: polysaccharide deacetylase family protein [Bacteroidia bacterium]|nr:polysaccharide deacetylase family protein [Bacteroidia bacterium]